MRLLADRVPPAPMIALDEAFKWPKVAARQMLFCDIEPIFQIGSPSNFRNEPAHSNLRRQEAGQHMDTLTQEMPARHARAR